MNVPLLEVQGLSKSFGATVALSDLDFELRAGEIHALVGQNGAGKSTFIKILAGIYQPDQGIIKFNGRPVKFGERQPGIAFIHQDLALIPSLSVVDNFALVAGYGGKYDLVNWRKIRRETSDSLNKLGIDLDPDTVVADLPIGDRALIAIARALHLQSQIIVLDEPTATLPAADVSRLFNALRNLREQGCGILYVSHRLAEVRSLADRITVVRDGKVRTTVLPQDVSEVDLANLIVGGTLSTIYQRPETIHIGKNLLEVSKFSASGVQRFDFVVKEGEVVGITGLRGAGHEAIGQALYGLIDWTGSVKLDSKPYKANSPKDALKRKVAFVSGDRSLSLSTTLSIRENILLNPDFSSVPGWIRRPSKESETARSLINKFHILPPEPDRRLDTLSGGNAQKVVLARGLDPNPRLLLLEEPTTGVDVGARAEFYKFIGEATGRGVGIILISTDYDEVTKISHRVIIFSHGRVVSVLEGAEISVERISKIAMGGTL